MFENSKITNYLVMFALGVIFFGSGFYFGNKTGVANTLNSNVQSNIDKQKSTLVTPPNLEIIKSEGISWIKANQEPKCPETHPIKGKFTAGGNKFYDTNYKGFDKIKPDICFVSVDFAKNTAGFVQKF
jgi:hypothetical protein